MTLGAIRMTFDFHLTGRTMTECFLKINKAFLHCNKHFLHSILSLLMYSLPLFFVPPLFFLHFRLHATIGSLKEAACDREVFQIRGVAEEGGPAAPEGCPGHPEGQKVSEAGGEDQSPGAGDLPQASDQPAQQTASRFARHGQLRQPQMSPLPALCTDKSLEGEKKD